MSDQPAIMPIDYERRRQWWLIRRLMPDATHICCRCWLPIFGPDDPHECKPPSQESSQEKP